MNGHDAALQFYAPDELDRRQTELYSHDTRGSDMPRTSEMIESKFLKKEDVGEDGTVVTVAAVAKVNVAKQDDPPDYRWTIQFEEFDKPMVLNSTNIKLAEKIFSSDDTDDWIGKRLVAYNDPNITFGKDVVGGIRLKQHRKAAPPRELSNHRQNHGAQTQTRPGDPDDLTGEPPF